MNKRTSLIFVSLFLAIIVLIWIAPAAADTDCNPPSPGTTCLVNPLKFLGINSPEELVVSQTRNVMSIIGLLAIAFTVFNGFRLVVAMDEESIKSAKESLTWSVGGFVVAILSFTMISGVAQILGFQPSAVGQDTLKNPINIGSYARSGDFVAVVNAVMVNFLGLIGFATTAMIIYYGYIYITSAGNEESIQKAKDGLKWSILGFTITLLSYTIINSIHLYLVRT